MKVGEVQKAILKQRPMKPIERDMEIKECGACSGWINLTYRFCSRCGNV